MKAFGRNGKLAELPRGSRLVYTGFLVFATLQLASAAALFVDMTTLQASSVAELYRGSQPTRAVGDDKIELPADAVAPPARVAPSFGHLMQVTHAHLYAMPVSWLILSHIFLISGAARWLKVAAIGGMFAGIASHVALPWIIEYVGASFAPLFVPSGVLLGASSLTMIAGALFEMWFRRVAE